MRPAKRRELGRPLTDHFRVSTRRASAVALLTRSTLRYQPRPSVNEAIATRTQEIVATRFRHGYWRIYVLLRQEDDGSTTSAYTASTSLQGSTCSASGPAATGPVPTVLSG